MADEDDFLSRWSRRKRAVATKEPRRSGLDPEPLGEAGQEVPDQVRDSRHEVEPETEEDEAKLLQELGLPQPETLKEGDDFSAFMQAGVPQFLRKRALRVLWRSNPVLANLDGLNDYDEDFTSPELTQKVLATGYQVGRGFVKQVLEDSDVEEASVAEDVVALSVEPESEDADSKDNSDVEPVEEPPSEPEQDVPFRPRRMRFES